MSKVADLYQEIRDLLSLDYSVKEIAEMFNLDIDMVQEEKDNWVEDRYTDYNLDDDLFADEDAQFFGSKDFL